VSNFRLNLKKRGAWTGTYEWRVHAFREYSSTTDKLNPKFEDSIFTDAFVERTIKKDKVSAKVDPSKLFELAEVAYRIKIPLIGVEFPVGEDGTDYEVTFHTFGRGSVKIEWWSHYPEEWQPLAKWFIEMTTFLDEAIDNKDA
jgi:hypothetical protein